MPFLPPAPFSPVYAPPAASSGGYFPGSYFAPTYFPPTFFPGGGAATSLSPDLVAALVARLRAQGVGAALGEAGGVRKIYADGVMGSPGLPWAEVSEPHEDLTPETSGDDAAVYYVGAGEITLDVYAAGKLQARQLRASAVTALNDAPLTFSDGVLLQFRLTGPLSPPVQGVSVAAPKAYLASAKFGYVVERTF